MLQHLLRLTKPALCEQLTDAEIARLAEVSQDADCAEKIAADFTDWRDSESPHAVYVTIQSPHAGHKKFRIWATEHAAHCLALILEPSGASSPIWESVLEQVLIARGQLTWEHSTPVSPDQRPTPDSVTVTVESGNSTRTLHIAADQALVSDTHGLHNFHAWLWVLSDDCINALNQELLNIALQAIGARSQRITAQYDASAEVPASATTAAAQPIRPDSLSWEATASSCGARKAA